MISIRHCDRSDVIQNGISEHWNKIKQVKYSYMARLSILGQVCLVVWSIRLESRLV